MTNADKFLKDGVSRQFLTDFSRWYYSTTREIKNVDTILADFLAEKAQPTLTETEKIILRNIKGYTTIIRNAENNIQVENEDGSFACLCAFNHLFQFIKFGEKYEIKELIEDD